MKIIYIVKSKLHFYPPCVSQIRIIKRLGYDIEVFYGTCDEKTIQILESEGIKCKKVSNIKDEYYGKINKLKGWIKFRIDLYRNIKEYNSDDTIFWFGNAETVIPMKGLLGRRKYIVSLLELLDSSPIKLKLLHGILENALKVTCCEETRAYLIRKWFSLRELPYIFPNKPFNQITARRVTPTSDITKSIIDQIKNEEIIIYQGYLQNTEELVEVAYALKMLNSRYKLVLIGIDEFNSYEKVKKIYSNTVFYPYIPAPLHLEITSYAKFGILFYRPTTLNNAFCAPNKIFEYGGFGIPMIGNNIPGLKNTIGNSKSGCCIELTRENIYSSLMRMEQSYNSFSKNARDYFDSVDNYETMKELLKEIPGLEC
jgi:hypothetical protein